MDNYPAAPKTRPSTKLKLSKLNIQTDSLESSPRYRRMTHTHKNKINSTLKNQPDDKAKDKTPQSARHNVEFATPSASMRNFKLYAVCDTEGKEEEPYQLAEPSDFQLPLDFITPLPQGEEA